VKQFEKRNQLDSTILGVEKTLNENRAKFSQEEITATEAALEKAKTALTEHADHALVFKEQTMS